MRKKRNTCGGKYYVINNPMPINENTGFFSVSEKYLLAQDKDFLFEWINPHTNKLETKVLSKEYVLANIKKIPKWKEDELLKSKHITCMFWLIPYQTIVNY